MAKCSGAVAEGLERRALLSAVAWTGAAGDSRWTTAGNWSSAPALPGPADDVTIPAAAGAILLSSGSQSIQSLTCGEALSVEGGTLAIGSTARLSATATLNGGTLSGGQWTFSGAAGNRLVVTAAAGNTLDGLAVNGSIDLLQVGSSMKILGGLVLNGTMRLGDPSGSAYGAQVHFGDAASPAGDLSGTGAVLLGGGIDNGLFNDSGLAGTAGTLTVGQQILIQGGRGTICQGGSLLNEGTIRADSAGGLISVAAEVLTNQGTFSVSNGSSLSVSGINGDLGSGFSISGSGSQLSLNGTDYVIDNGFDVPAGTMLTLGGTWTNAAGSTIHSEGATLRLGDQTIWTPGRWTNQGTIIANSSTVDLGGAITQQSIGTLSRIGGTVNLTGSFSGDLALDATTGAWNLRPGDPLSSIGGMITNSTISTADGSALVVTIGQLDNVTVNGTLDLSQFGDRFQGASLRLSDSFVLNGTMMLGRADGSTYATVHFDDSANLEGTGSLVFGGDPSNALVKAWPATLTIGPQITIGGQNGQVGTWSALGNIANSGTIRADTGGGTIVVQALSVTNQGTMTASATGATLAVDLPTNSSLANPGTISAQGGGALIMTNPGTTAGISVNGSGSSVTLDGTNYVIDQGLTASAGTTLTLHGTWSNAVGSTISATDATLNLGGSDPFSTNQWSNSGTITVTDSIVNVGGAFTQAGLGVVSRIGGTVDLVGTATGPITLDDTTGVWKLDGWLQDAVVSEQGGGVLLPVDGTFNHVTVDGDLDLRNNAVLRVFNGLELNGTMYLGSSDGSAWGKVSFGYLNSISPGELSGHATVLFGGSLQNTLNNVSTSSGSAGMLTLGPDVVVHGKNGSVSCTNAAGSLLNQGSIVDDVQGGNLNVGTQLFTSGSLVNQGTISAEGGGGITAYGISGSLGPGFAASGTGSNLMIYGNTYTIDQGIEGPPGTTVTLTGGWTNAAGSVITATDSTLNLGMFLANGSAFSWRNTGTIRVVDSTLNLGGSFSSALGTLSRTGGVVNVTGTMLGGLALDASTGSWNLVGGSVSGTLSESGGASLNFTAAGGTLSRVTTAAVLDLARQTSTVNVLGGLVLNGTLLLGDAAGSTSGTIYFGDPFSAAGSLTGAGTVVFGTRSGNGIFNASRLSGSSGKLTIGSGITVHGANGKIDLLAPAESLVNQGTIFADMPGGTITIGHAGSPITNQGTISAQNGGTLNIDGTLTDTGVMRFDSGGALSGRGALVVNSAPVTFSRNSTPVSNTIGALTLNGTGALDLANNAMNIIYGNGSDPLTIVRSYVLLGSNHGAWNGPGIITSAADATHTLGIGDTAEATLPGVTDNAVVVKWTRIGDANLDGTVGFSDLLMLAQHYGQTTANWDQGDFDYDGTVDFTDLLSLAQNYGGTATSTGSAEPGAKMLSHP